jgi:hypothetical protein
VTFPERSCAVAKSFLQSVVVFDDLARLDEPRLGQRTEEAKDETDEAADPFGASPGQLTTPPEVETLPSGEAGVDVKELSDAFAENGLICGFLKPSPAEAQAEGQLLLGAARRADIVILDWVIDRDEGDTASELVSALLKADREEEEQRLRLVVIYTSQSDLDSIVDRLAGTLEEATHEPPDRRDYVLTSGASRVAVFAKEASQAVGDAAARRLPERDLPQRLIEEFADFTMGLVPNVVLAGLAAIRTDTHRVLQVLDRRIDPAYVGQRLLLRDPAEAEEQLVEVVAAELRSVMEDREIGRQADAEVVEEWVEWRLQTEDLFLWTGIDSEKATRESKALLRHGIGSSEQPVADFKSRAGITSGRRHLEAARVFARDAQEGDRANDDLAMLFALRSHYSKPDRVLQLGTIVRRDTDYFLCVQPVCDSLRVDGERDFPFLPLIEESDHFDFVLNDPTGSRVTLCLERKPHRLQQFRFRADPDKRCVVAVADENEFVFTDIDGARYGWVARLQDAHGQRVVHGLGSELGRIGLSESEWLRKISGAPE